MEDVIIIKHGDKNVKFVEKNEDMTCRFEKKNYGVYKGIIETISTSGKYRVRVLEKVEDR